MARNCLKDCQSEGSRSEQVQLYKSKLSKLEKRMRRVNGAYLIIQSQNVCSEFQTGITVFPTMQAYGICYLTKSLRTLDITFISAF